MREKFMADKKLKKLLSAKTPEEYIDLSVKSDLTPGEKMRATRQWLNATGFTIKDIEYARNRHPYWKEKKGLNRNERTKKRFKEHDYSDGTNRRWTEADLRKFLELNEKSTDIELAQELERSIPSIQGIRRRYNLGRKITQAAGTKKAGVEKMLYFVGTDEKILRKELQELSPATVGRVGAVKSGPKAKKPATGKTLKK